MDAQLVEDLKKQIDDANWSMLEDHHKKRSLVLIDQSIQLEMVGTCLAMDNSKLLEGWMAEGKVQNVTDDMTEIWMENKDAYIFRFLIIQPYVLIQIKAS